MVTKSSADHTTTVKNACGIAREETLSGRIDSSSENSPMSSVSVPRYDQIEIGFLNIGVIVFGVMAKQDAETIHCGKALKDRRIGEIISSVDAGG